jgi:hypothetical protein
MQEYIGMHEKHVLTYVKKDEAPSGTAKHVKLAHSKMAGRLL